MFELMSPNAQLENLNHRTELDGEDFVTAFDLKLSCEAEAPMAGFLMGCLDEAHAPEFWNNDQHGDIKYHGFRGDIHSTAEFANCEVKFKDVAMKDVRVNKFSFHPISGRKIRLTLRVQLRPDDKQMVKLSHYQKKGGKLVIKTDDGYSPAENYQMEI